MDPPCLIHLGFLLLTLAAPRPNTAMPSDRTAERTQSSSSDRTNVSVYHCKDCEISTVKSCNTGRFEKIAETQSQTFSNEIIELVTRNSCILMCFQQANTLPEGIYAIFWVKAEGMGHSCDKPNLDFSAKRRCNISTEKNKICCEAETKVWEANHSLNCYCEESGAKPRKSIDDIPDEGILDDSTKDKVIGISISLLIVVLCAGIVTRHYWRRCRNAPVTI